MIDVSVVIVTVAQPPLLDRCLAAIASDPGRPREVVVVDQGRPGLRDRLKRALSGSGVDLRHLRIEPVGVSAARNAGIAAARSRWIAFTDDDCVPEPGWLDALMDAVADGRAALAAGRVLPLDEGRPGAVAVSSRTDNRERFLSQAAGALPWEVGTGGNILADRDLLVRAGGFCEQFGPGASFRAAEDVELIERLLELGTVAHYTPPAVVRHEMKKRRGRMRRRFPYGLGMGAMVAHASRSRRPVLIRAYWLAQLRSAAGAARRGRLTAVLELVLVLSGFAVGFASARTCRDRSPDRVA